MLDVFQDIDKNIGTFLKGLITRVDDREAPEDSLADIRGFNLSETYNQLVRDFGATKYNSWTLPFSLATLRVNVTAIYGIATLRIGALGEEFVVIYGTAADNLPHFWIRKSYNLLNDASGVVDTWTELTERVSGTINKKAGVGDVVFFFTPGAFTSDQGVNYYRTWVLYNSTRGGYAYIASSVFNSPNVELTTLEAHPDWVTGDSVVAYRHPDTRLLNIDNGVVGTERWFNYHVIQERLDIGWQRSVPTPEFPVTVERAKRDFFFNVGSNDFLRKGMDQLSFARETPSYDSPGAFGIEVVWDAGVSTQNQIPVATISNTGTGQWTSSDGAAELCNDINDGRADTFITSTGGSGDPNPFIKFTMTNVANVAIGFARIVVVARTAHPIANNLKVGIYESATLIKEVVLSLTDRLVGYAIDVPLGQFTNIGANLVISLTNLTFPGIGVKKDVSDVWCELHSQSIQTVPTRAVIVPVFNDYLVGKPCLLPSITGNSVFPQLYLSFALMDKRLTQIYVFTDNGVPTKTLSQFVSAWVFNLSATGGNARGIVYDTVGDWRFYNNVGVGTIGTSGVIVAGTGTTFTTAVKIGDYIQPILGVSNKPVRRVIAITDDTHLTLDSPFQSDLLPGKSYNITTNYKFVSAGVGVGADQPRRLTNGRDETNLQQLSSFLGYGLVDQPVDIAPKWRFQVQASYRQNSQVFVDQSDDVLRLAVYSGTVLNDHVYPQVEKDNNGFPLLVFLNAKGELLGVLGQLGLIYSFKAGSAEILDATATTGRVYNIDCLAKRSIIQTTIGIVFAGQYGIYIFPKDGGLDSPISDNIRDEYLSILNTPTFPYKKNIVAQECKDMGAIMFTVQISGAIGSTLQSDYTTYFYHTKLEIWWKREFVNPPTAYAPLTDNTLLFAGRATASANETKLLRYPDRNTYLDDTSSFPFVAQTQWLMGDKDIYKMLRTIIPLILSNVNNINFKISIEFDRTGAIFDVIHGTTVNGILEKPFVIKTPNTWREVRFTIENDGAAPEGQFNFSEIRFVGETFSNPQSN